MGEIQRPFSRSDYNQALIRNSLIQPFNVLLLAAILIAGLLLDVFVLVLPVAAVAYGLAVARTYFDDDEQKKVLEGERARRRQTLEKGRIDPGTLAPPIRDLMSAALQRESRIREAIERAQLPFEEVSAEVDRFLSAMESSAGRGQLLYETLAESPPAWVQQRLAEVQARGDAPGREQLVEALTKQLEVLRRMEGQLQRFYDEMERILVELDVVRGSLVSASASTEAANQQQLAAEVRGLREEVGALADGMSEAYERPDVPAS